MEVAPLFLPKNYTFLEFFSLLFYVIVTVENAFQNLCVLLLNNKRISRIIATFRLKDCYFLEEFKKSCYFPH